MARAAAAGAQARCHGWLEWRSHGLPILVWVIHEVVGGASG